ncbi:helix-turn-helix domain-containing protein [Actinacidiphila acidipaludis]|nr:helix-turn-helix domain-containing protein [Streptomyces acidipaludis]
MPTRDRPPRRSGSEHEVLLLELLGRHGPLSRSGLRELTGFSRTTVYDAVARLVDDGAVVVRSGRGRSGPGRPAEELTLSPGTARAIGSARIPHDEGDVTDDRL